MDALEGYSPCVELLSEDAGLLKVVSHNAGDPDGPFSAKYWKEIREAGIHIVLLQDHKQRPLTRKAGNAKAAQYLGRGAKGVWCTGTRDVQGNYIGGTAVLVGPKMAPLVVGEFKDEWKLGRFCGVRIRGAGQKAVTFVSTYNAPPSGNDGSMWQKQVKVLNVSKAADVATRHWEHMGAKMTEAAVRGDEVIVGGDTNTLISTKPDSGQRASGS